MFQRKRRINDLFSRLKNLSTLKEFKTRELGELISGIKGVTFESSQAKEICDSILEIKKEIPEKKRAIQRINRIVANADSIKQELANGRKNLLEKEKETRAVYEKIGRLAYDLFKSHGKELSKHEALFIQLARLDERAETHKPREESLNTADRSVISKIMNAAKTVYTNRVLQANLAKYAKVYQGAGKKIVESDFPKDAQDKVLDELVDQVHGMEKEIDVLAKSSETLEGKKEKLTNELESLGVKGSTFLRVRELESERKKFDALLLSKQEALGNAYVDNLHILTKESADVAGLLKEIKDIGKESDKIKAEIRKIEAEIEVDAIRERIRKSALRIEQLERTIGKNQDEIKVQESKISQLEKEKQKYEKLIDGKLNT
jgi:chromosome segregation ATPase